MGDSDEVVAGVDHVRQRPGMWVGNTGPAGRQHLLWALVSNSIDQVVAGRASELSVVLHSGGAATVADNGRGIEVEGRVGEPGHLEQLFTTVRRSSKTPAREFACTFGTTWTVGLGVVSALCQRVEVEVRRGGAGFRQAFSRGVAVTGLESTGAGSQSGTTIRIEPDPEIFDTDDWLVEDVIARLYELSCLLPGLEVTFSQEPVRIGTDAELSALVRRLAGRLPGSGTGPVALLERRSEGSTVRVALTWRQPYWVTEPELDLAPVVHLWCNFRHSPWPGPHSAGLAQGLRDVFDVHPDDDDHFTRLARGLVAVVDLRLPSPVWKGQFLNDLASAEVADLVRATIVEQLPNWLAQTPDLAQELRTRIAPRRDEDPWPVQRRYVR